jgi:hypothetical protein
MSARIRHHIRSNVIGYLALFVALSGTAYAVDGPLPGQNQVGSADIINGEVQTADIKDANLTTADIRPGAVTTGKILDGEVRTEDLGDVAVTTDKLSFDPTTQAELDDHKGSGDHDSRYFTKSELSASDGDPPNEGANRLHWDGLTGVPSGFSDGTDDTLPTTLPSGRTLAGVFALLGHGEVNNGIEIASGDISFALPLASAPTPVVLQDGTATSPPDCPGTAADPQAAPGVLCVYENDEQNESPSAVPYPTVTAPGSRVGLTASRFGAGLYMLGQAAGTDWVFRSEGAWAVTAP